MGGRSWRVGAVIAGILVGAALPLSAQADPMVFASNSDAPNPGLAAFAVGADGSLTARPGSPFAAGKTPGGVAVSPDARTVYVANFDDDSVSAFRIDADGALTSLGDTVAGNRPTDIEPTPDGRFLMVANRDGSPVVSHVTVLAIGTDGSLTPTATTNQSLGIYSNASLAISPDGRFLYVSGNRGPEGPPPTNAERAIAVATIGNNGSLTPIAGSPFYGPFMNNFEITLAPDGSRLFMAGVGTNQIAVYNLNQTTGTPTQVIGSPFAATNGPLQLVASPTGDRLLAGNAGTASIQGFAVNATTGAVSPIASSLIAASDDVHGVAFTPSGGRVYGSVSANPGQVVGGSVAGNGSLTALTGSPYTTGGAFPDYFSLAVAPTQTPEPKISTSAAEAGKPVAMDASATRVRGGTATRYDWDFGDGTTLADGGPTPQHTYARAGTYTATVQVLNDCAAGAVAVNGVVTVGNQIYCNGPRQGSGTQQVEVTDKVEASVSAKRTQKQKNKIVVKVKIKAGEHVTAKAKGKVKLKGGAKLKPRKTTVETGKKKTIKLKPKPKAKRRIAAALADGRKPKAKVQVTLTDDLGTKRTDKVSVKLKPAGRR